MRPGSANATSGGGELVRFQGGALTIDVDGAALTLPVWGWAFVAAAVLGAILLVGFALYRCLFQEALEKSRGSRLISGSSRLGSERSRGGPEWNVGEVNAAASSQGASTPRVLLHQASSPRIYERMPSGRLPASGFDRGFGAEAARMRAPDVSEFQITGQAAPGRRHGAPRDEGHAGPRMVSGRV